MSDYPTPNNGCDLSGQVALVTGTTLLSLCAPASECVTGTVITVDDGQAPR